MMLLLVMLQSSEDLYDQKPAEPEPTPVAPAPAPAGGVVQSAPRTSRFIYTDEVSPTSVSNSDNNNQSTNGHVTAPATVADFFAEFGASPIRPSFSNGRSKAQVLYLLDFKLVNGSVGLH